MTFLKCAYLKDVFCAIRTILKFSQIIEKNVYTGKMLSDSSQLCFIARAIQSTSFLSAKIPILQSKISHDGEVRKRLTI